MSLRAISAGTNRRHTSADGGSIDLSPRARKERAPNAPMKKLIVTLTAVAALDAGAVEP